MLFMVFRSHGRYDLWLCNGREIWIPGLRCRRRGETLLVLWLGDASSMNVYVCLMG